MNSFTLSPGAFLPRKSLCKHSQSDKTHDAESQNIKQGFSEAAGCECNTSTLKYSPTQLADPSAARLKRDKKISTNLCLYIYIFTR